MFDHHQPLLKRLDVVNSFLIMSLQFADKHHQQFGRNELNQRTRRTDLLSTGSIIKVEVDLILTLSSLKMIDLVNQKSSGGYCYILPHVLLYYFISVYSHPTHV